MTLPSVPTPARVARFATVVLFCALAAAAAAGPLPKVGAPLARAMRAAVLAPVLRRFERAATLVAATEAALHARRP